VWPCNELREVERDTGVKEAVGHGPGKVKNKKERKLEVQVRENGKLT